MSAADNVTPIVQTPARAAKRVRQRPGIVLAEIDDLEGYTIQDVVTGLHGVCLALDVCCDNTDIERGELATAARVLSSILQMQVDS